MTLASAPVEPQPRLPSDAILSQRWRNTDFGIHGLWLNKCGNMNAKGCPITMHSDDRTSQIQRSIRFAERLKYTHATLFGQLEHVWTVQQPDFPSSWIYYWAWRKHAPCLMTYIDQNVCMQNAFPLDVVTDTEIEAAAKFYRMVLELNAQHPTKQLLVEQGIVPRGAVYDADEMLGVLESLGASQVQVVCGDELPEGVGRLEEVRTPVEKQTGVPVELVVKCKVQQKSKPKQILFG